MRIAIDVASWLLIASGSFFAVVGMIGLVRMPEVFTRMHASSVMETLGAGLLLAGMMLQAGMSLVTFKLFFIFVLFFFTAPVVTHALAQAAQQGRVRSFLAEDRREARRRGGRDAHEGDAP
jgi:multicomponent Na+:H+ antiporter subunit G